MTGGGEISIILTEELESSRRRQRTKAFRAALEAEYAERPAQGTMARLEPVLLTVISLPWRHGWMDGMSLQNEARLSVLFLLQERQEFHR